MDVSNPVAMEGIPATWMPAIPAGMTKKVARQIEEIQRR
jgi:hypothetical protein